MVFICCRIRKWIKFDRFWDDGFVGSDFVLVFDDFFVLVVLFVGGDVGDLYRRLFLLLNGERYGCVRLW